jgi:hypothetical protein
MDENYENFRDFLLEGSKIEVVYRIKESKQILKDLFEANLIPEEVFLETLSLIMKAEKEII